MVSLQADIKQLEDLNQVTIMLGCEEEFKITDEKAVILLCKKLSGNLKQIGEDILSQIKDRDNLMEDASSREDLSLLTELRRQPSHQLC